MNLFGIINVIFIVAYLLIGLYASRSTKSLDDYYIMNQSASSFLITGTLIATNVSSVTFVGYTGSIYTTRHLPYVTIFGLTVITALFVGLYFGRFFWRMKVYTLPDYFTKRFCSEKVRVAATAIVFVSCIGYLVTVMIGTNVVLKDMYGWPENLSLIITLSVITIFTVMGGMRGVVVTDTIMMLVILGAALYMAPSIIRAAGGWPAGMQKAASALPNFMDWHGTKTPFDAFWFFIETNLFSLVLGMASPQLLSRTFIAKDEKTLARAEIFQALTVPLFVFGFLGVFGLLPIVAKDIDPVNSYSWVASNLVPPAIGGIALAGVIAAALSTASSLFQQAAAALSRDIYQRYINPNVSEKKFMLVSKLCVVITAVIIFGLTSIQETSVAAIVYAQLFAGAAWAAWCPAIVLGVLWKRSTKQGAFWSMTIGLITAMYVGCGRIFHYTPSWLPPSVVGLVTSLVIFIGVSLLTKPTEKEIEFFEEIRKPVVSR